MTTSTATQSPASSEAAIAVDPRLLRARTLLDTQDMGLSALAVAVGISPAHLQRRFRACFGVSPAEYRAQRRLDSLKRSLKDGSDVSAALYDAGFGSPSRIYENGAAKIGMTPANYRDGGRGQVVCWSTLQTRLGLALVAATQRGICAVALGENATELADELRREFPNAELQHVDAGRDAFLAPRVRAIADLLEDRAPATRLDAEMRGTAFQARVWDALMRIPRGQTRSYVQVAIDIGAPKAARAVAQACARNRLAVVVPCHRVVRGDGSPGGYRWGLPRKLALLDSERVQSPLPAGEG
jgi:AraC family transcriptional regulator of adaptative response/methylated-DNA-[protein]-cysteine methyltransferase